MSLAATADSVSALHCNGGLAAQYPWANRPRPAQYNVRTRLLPTVTAALARRWHGSTMNASHCANLAVPGVGSTSLANLFGMLHSPYAAHKHSRSLEALHAAGARCIVTTLRDPAERLITGFAFERDHSHGSSMVARSLISALRHTITPSQFLSQLRKNASGVVDMPLVAIPPTLRWAINARTGQETMPWANPFLIPQVMPPAECSCGLSGLVSHVQPSTHAVPSAVHGSR